VHLVFGANTDVGKSVVSAGLVRAAATASAVASMSSRRVTSANYINPLQCGGSDESFVLDQRDEDGLERVACRTLFSRKSPVSPHLASRMEGLPVCDAEVLASLRSSLARIDDGGGATTMTTTRAAGGKGSSVTIIESAGGALSPSSSSPLNDRSDALGEGRWGWSTQADLYKSLDVPVVFVGDGKLGGIGVTLASLEALWSRGYRIDAVVFIEPGGADGDGGGVGGGGGIAFGGGGKVCSIRETTSVAEKVGKLRCLPIRRRTTGEDNDEKKTQQSNNARLRQQRRRPRRRQRPRRRRRRR
jgi:dethiobiotin synthetase/adenosylmethionine--8-amino-7-oxononanoate aminotransferase